VKYPFVIFFRGLLARRAKQRETEGGRAGKTISRLSAAVGEGGGWFGVHIARERYIEGVKESRDEREKNSVPRVGKKQCWGRIQPKALQIRVRHCLLRYYSQTS
jgi:hypothetical protein